ncbi:hypothetical protein CK218_29730 [Mesorhizobium sp. WSM3879]|nr:hypothetical protein CK218_29690 [Mesorhizobium sp. WSM3879]PBB77579.1 hypothetical protein CK218_29730 [Mesorhizobium sp. WSM3879]
MVCQRSRMSGPYGPMLREAPDDRRRAVALAGFARRQNADVALAQNDDPLDRAATILWIALGDDP